MQDNPPSSSTWQRRDREDHDLMQPPARHGEKTPSSTTTLTPRRCDEESGTTSQEYAQPNHKPPMSFVLIRETPLGGTASASQSVCSTKSSAGGLFQRAIITTSVVNSPPMRASIPGSNVPSITGASFRLQPRGRPGSSPFSSSSSRGRKRNSQCLSPACSTTIQTGETFIADRDGSVTTLAQSPHSTQNEGGIQRHPAEVESAMLSLSIASPKVNHQFMDFLTSASPGAAMPSRVHPRSFLGSSFVSYSSSLVGGGGGGGVASAEYLRPRDDSTRSGNSTSRGVHPSMSPASSVKSSPRFAPLTVLQNLGGGSAMGTPTNRPPRHNGGPSCLLFSLDGSSHPHPHKNGGDERTVALPSTPTKIFPAAVACSPAVSTSSSITREYTPARLKRNPHPPATPEATKPIIRSPMATRMTPLMSSPATQAIKTIEYSQAATPLPSIKLTPRSTPRSTASINPDGSMLSTPQSARELGLLPVDFILDQSFESRSLGEAPSGRRTFPGLYSPTGFGDERQSAYAPRPNNPATFLAPTTRTSSYLPVPDWCDADASGTSPQTRPEQGFTASFLSPQQLDHSMRSERFSSPDVRMDHAGGSNPRVQTTSLLAPLPNGGFLEEMMRKEERAAAMDADGSLSDPDEDEPFVLANPGILAAELHPEDRGRSRQRQRIFYSLNKSNPLARQCGNARVSSMSLTSNHASNASLLGTDIVRGDSMASLSGQNTGSGSRRSFSFLKLDNNPAGRTVDEKKPSESPRPSGFRLGSRYLSDDSLSSIGLPLEPPAGSPMADDGGRDLVTPPPAVEDSGARRVAPSSSGDKGNFPINWTPPPRSVCISSSKPGAVHATIAMMAYESGHNHKFSPQMECPAS